MRGGFAKNPLGLAKELRINRRPEAPAFSSICSGLVCTNNCGCNIVQAQNPGERELRHRKAGRGGKRLKALHGFERLAFEPGPASKRRPSCGLPRAFRRCRRLARLVLARQHALRERRPDDLGDPFGFAERDDLRLGLSPKERILRLARNKADDAGHFERGADAVRRPFGKAHIAGLARFEPPRSKLASFPRAAFPRRSDGTDRDRHSPF